MPASLEADVRACDTLACRQPPFPHTSLLDYLPQMFEVYCFRGVDYGVPTATGDTVIDTLHATPERISCAKLLVSQGSSMSFPDLPCVCDCHLSSLQY